jgi:hypothetical protein
LLRSCFKYRTPRLALRIASIRGNLVRYKRVEVAESNLNLLRNADTSPSQPYNIVPRAKLLYSLGYIEALHKILSASPLQHLRESVIWELFQFYKTCHVGQTSTLCHFSSLVLVGLVSITLFQHCQFRQFNNHFLSSNQPSGGSNATAIVEGSAR